MGDVARAAAAGLAPATPLAECEAVIERGLARFIEVGEALLRIRDERLYREDFETFEDYCRERWGFGRTRAHRLIEGAEVAAMLPNGNTPANEAQARELAPLKDDPDTLREAWQETLKRTDGKPTATDVRQVVAERKPTHESPLRARPKRPSTDIFDNVVTTFSGTARALQTVDVDGAVQEADSETRDKWARELTETIQVIGRLRKKVRGDDAES
jgi:hypothetical protein